MYVKHENIHSVCWSGFAPSDVGNYSINILSDMCYLLTKKMDNSEGADIDATQMALGMASLILTLLKRKQTGVSENL